jgi:rRNA maturation endonuclease Nob1
VREAGERVLTALRGIWGSARPAPRLSCAGCGTELRPEFRRCPVCGKEVS